MYSIIHHMLAKYSIEPTASCIINLTSRGLLSSPQSVTITAVTTVCVIIPIISVVCTVIATVRVSII